METPFDSININGHTYIRAASVKRERQYLPLAGKIALVTGSGRGIGRGIALELARKGAFLVINYAKSSSAASSVVQEIQAAGSQAIAIQADISQPNEVFALFEQAIAHFGKLDIVVSNSGTEVWADEKDVTPEDFDHIFSLNSRGQFFVAQQGLKYLGRGGRIILMSSIAATASGVPNHALYAGSKASVEGFARSFAVDCGPKEITVNAIAPGGIKSEMFDANAWHYAPGGRPDMSITDIERGIASACPLQRVGTPSDIGKAVSLLASEDSEWINGITSFLLVHDDSYGLDWAASIWLTANVNRSGDPTEWWRHIEVSQTDEMQFVPAGNYCQGGNIRERAMTWNYQGRLLEKGLIHLS